MPRANWARDLAAEVAELQASGLSTAKIAEQLNRSDTTIREALKCAREVPDEAEGHYADRRPIAQAHAGLPYLVGPHRRSNH